MNQIQERKRSMLKVLLDMLATAPAATLSSMPNIVVLIEYLTDKVAEINLIAEAQTWSRGGYAIDKEDYKLDMSIQATNVALSVRAYANNTGDMALKKAMNFSASYITNCSENKSVDKCRFINTKATELLTELSTYGVMKEDLDSLEKSIDTFESSIPFPRTNIISRKRATDLLKILFKECETCLGDMDALAEMLKYRDKDFYVIYFSSRKVIQPSYKKLSVVGIVRDINGFPLSKVRVNLKGTLISKFTTDNGGFELKNLESKVYEFVLEKAGYVSTTREVAITANERTEVSVVMTEIKDFNNKTA